MFDLNYDVEGVIFDFAFSDRTIIGLKRTDVLARRAARANYRTRHWWIMAYSNYNVFILKWVIARGLFVNVRFLLQDLAKNDRGILLNEVLDIYGNDASHLYVALLGALENENSSSRLAMQLYERLYSATTITRRCKHRLISAAAKKGDVGLIEWLRQKGAKPSYTTFLSATNSNTAALQHLKPLISSVFMRERHIIEDAVKAGCKNVECLRWLMSYFECEPKNVIITAAQKGFNDIILHLLGRVRVSSRFIGGLIEHAIRNNRYKTVKLLYARHYCIRPITHVLSIKHGNLKIIKFLFKQKGFTDLNWSLNEICVAAAKYNQTDILRWGFDYADAKFGHEDCIETLFNACISAVCAGQVHIVKLICKEIEPKLTDKDREDGYSFEHIIDSAFEIYHTNNLMPSKRAQEALAYIDAHRASI